MFTVLGVLPSLSVPTTVTVVAGGVGISVPDPAARCAEATLPVTTRLTAVFPDAAKYVPSPPVRAKFPTAWHEFSVTVLGDTSKAGSTGSGGVTAESALLAVTLAVAPLESTTAMAEPAEH